MPIPKPKKKEKESDYMSRCMPAIKEEFTSQDQRVAVCLTTFRKGKKQKAKATEIEVDITESEAYQKAKTKGAGFLAATPEPVKKEHNLS